ncbi:hypothetical protein LQ327_14890 [Actinomycetospora endophytica]|uniref:Flagellin-like protein n=1 Tax=Actinomycetospora endophytica TaxID=2291215 RepID=A0ABS8P8Q8_9PSEU|nr:hypothetical protein [Actinomycetospora endophytica]MCD2194657.1 hypothetical protein [Actinomycetospora endophytica]
MTGGPGMGGDSFTNFTTGRAGQRRSSADQGPVEDVRPSEVGGIGTPSLVIALVVVLAVLALLLFAAL